MPQSLMEQTVEEILSDYKNRDLIVQALSDQLNFTEYLHPKYKKRAEWPDDVQILESVGFHGKTYLLILNWVNIDFELYELLGSGNI